MREAVIGSLIALAVATPAAAEGFHAETRLAIAACQIAIKDSLPHPDSIRFLGHEVYLVEEGSNDRIVRLGYRARNDSGGMYTATADCPINPLPADWRGHRPRT
jgi:hypothetical protein